MRRAIIGLAVFCGLFAVFVGWLASGCLSGLLIGLFPVTGNGIGVTTVLLLCSLLTWTAMWILINEVRAA